MRILFWDKFKKLIGDGTNLGINISYEVQKKPNGIPEAFLIGEKFTVMSPDHSECVNIKGSDCYSFIKNREVNKK